MLRPYVGESDTVTEAYRRADAAIQATETALNILRPVGETGEPSD